MVGLATFVAAKQGGRIIVDEQGYHYKKTSVNKKTGVSYLRCRDKIAEKCDARAILIDESGYKSVKPDHTHGNRFVKNKVRAVEQEKIMAAANLPTVAPRAVFADITGTVNQEMTDFAAAYVRKSSTIARAIQRKRVAEKGYPSIPNTYSDLDNITDKLSSTMDGSKFLLCNDKTIPENPHEDAKRLMIFMSGEGRDTLASCEHWFVDGTFKSAPAPLFIQVKK